MPPIEYLKQCFTWDGRHLVWTDRPVEHFSSALAAGRFNKVMAGKEVTTDKVFLAGKTYLTSEVRLAFINDANPCEQVPRSAEYLGVYFHQEKGKYMAEVAYKRKRYRTKGFNTAREAYEEKLNILEAAGLLGLVEL